MRESIIATVTGPIVSSLIITGLIVAGLLLVSIPAAYGQTPAYGRRYNKSQVERSIRRVETSTDRLKREMDQLDRATIDRLPREDRVWDLVNNLERSTSGLRQHFDRTDSWWETRNEVQKVLDDARRLNRAVSRHREYFQLRARMAEIKRDLNTLARYYNLPTIR